MEEKMKGVNFIHMQNIEKGIYKSCQVQDKRPCAHGRWITARPDGYTGLKHRCMAAWLVFTGKADVLYFEGDQ